MSPKDNKKDQEKGKLPLDSPEIRRMSIGLNIAFEGMIRNAMEHAIEMGNIIIEMQNTMTHTQYMKWLKKQGGRIEDPDWYVHLARFAKKHPDIYKKLKRAGPDRLHMLTRLPLGQLRRLSNQNLVTVPGTGKRKKLYYFKLREVNQLVNTRKGLYRSDVKALAESVKSDFGTFHYMDELADAYEAADFDEVLDLEREERLLMEIYADMDRRTREEIRKEDEEAMKAEREQRE